MLFGSGDSDKGRLGLFAFSLGVFLATLLTYLPSVRYEMVGYDDQDYVYTNSRVLSGLSGENALWAVESCGYAYNWHPLTWLSLQVDASLLEKKPAAVLGGCPDGSFKPLSAVMHAHNVLLHAANAALLFLLIVLMVKRLDPDRAVFLPLAALFALLWAIHPLRTEVVCWVSERKELLSVFFMLLTMIAYIGGRGQRHRSTVVYLLSLLLFALALAAKPVAVTLPAVLFAWEWVMSGRRFGKALSSVVPFLLLAAGASALTLAAQGEPLDIGTQFSLWEKVVMSLSAPVIYLRQTFYPAGLSAFYTSKPPVPWVELCAGGVLVVAAMAVCVAWLRKRWTSVTSLLAFAVAWCLVSLVPMLGIVKVGDQPHSDRYTYWVGCGLAAVVALAVARYVRRREDVMVKALAAVVAVLAVATWLRMPVWRDSVALFSDAVPKSWNQQPVCALARIFREQGGDAVDQAEALLRDALSQTNNREISAEFAHLLACRAERSGFRIGDVDPAFAEAHLEAEKILYGYPKHALANEAMGIIEMKEGKFESALKRLELARVGSDDVGRVDRHIALCRECLEESKKGSHVQE